MCKTSLVDQEQCTFEWHWLFSSSCSTNNCSSCLQVLLELLQAGGIVQFEESRLIQMAEKAEL